MFGIINISSEKEKKNLFSLMNNPSHRFNNQQCSPVFDGDKFIAHNKSKDYFFEDEQFCLFFMGSTYNKLPHSTETSANKDLYTAEQLAHQYKIQGEYMANNIAGSFIIIISHKAENRIVVLRDPLGIEPIYYAIKNNTFYFSTELRRISAIPALCDIDWQYIKIVLSQLIPQDYKRTWFEHIKRVTPGTSFHWTPNSQSHNQYFNLSQIKKEPLSSAEAIQIFRDKLSLAVYRQIAGYGDIYAHFSGGLDSSGISAIAWEYSKQSNVSFKSYACGLWPNQINNKYGIKDDQEIQKATAQSIGLPIPEITSYNESSSIDEYSIGRQLPKTQDLKAYLELTLQDIASKSGKVLLSGFGGDECISYNQYPNFLSNAISQGHWKIFFQESKSLSYKTNISLFLNHLSSLNPISNHSSKKEVKVQPLKNRIEHNYLKSANRIDLNSSIIAHLTSPHISYRIEKEKELASYYDIEIKYPLLDLELISFFLSLPSSLKYYKRKGREFYREALKKWIDYPPFFDARKSRTATVPILDLRSCKAIGEGLIDYNAILQKLPPQLSELINVMPFPKDVNNRYHKFYHRKYLLLAEISNFVTCYNKEVSI